MTRYYPHLGAQNIQVGGGGGGGGGGSCPLLPSPTTTCTSVGLVKLLLLLRILLIDGPPAKKIRRETSTGLITLESEIEKFFELLLKLAQIDERKRQHEMNTLQIISQALAGTYTSNP